MKKLESTISIRVKCSNCGSKDTEYRFTDEGIEAFRCEECGSYTHINIHI